MAKTFNFYCDESCHLENDKQPYMLIAYVSTAYNEIKIHNEFIKNLRNKHNMFTEIKWSKVSKSKFEFYAELIDYFFSSEMRFRAIVVNKNQIDNERIGQSYDDFYYKMYYQLLHHKISMEYTYNVYLDIKDTLSAFKVRKLKEILNTRYNSIRNLQNIRSHESNIMQLTDLLMGAISYYKRGPRKVIAKNKLIEKIQIKSNYTLNEKTPKAEEKFNLFFIELQ